MAEEPGALLGPPPPESFCPKGTALPEVPRGGGALVPPSQGSLELLPPGFSQKPGCPQEVLHQKEERISPA